jgi:intergrase/recombinase
MKTIINLQIDDTLLDMMNKKEYEPSDYLNQMLWRELVLENETNYFNNLSKINFSDTSWEFKADDTQIDSDFKFLHKVFIKERVDFLNWLNKFSRGYKTNIQNTLSKAFSKEFMNFKESLENSTYSSKYFSLALRNLINYCMSRGLLKKSQSIDIKDKLKLGRSNVDMRVPTKNELNTLLEDISKFNKYDYGFLKILLESGLRTSDLVFILHNLNVDDVETVGDVVVIPIFNLRGSKQSFYLFCSKDSFDIVLENYEYFKEYNPERLKSHIKRACMIPLKYIRKLNFTKLIESGVSFEIANFIQGRAQQDMGFNHYLAKKSFALREYTKVLSEIINWR